MKALTVQQPYAGYIEAGIKHYETRPKPTKHRGEIVIHAGKHWDYELARLYSKVSMKFHVELPDYPRPIISALGVTLCIVTITDCVPVEQVDPSPLERAIGDYTPGRYAWVLENPRPIERVQVRGQLGLWNIADELITEAAR